MSATSNQTQTLPILVWRVEVLPTGEVRHVGEPGRFEMEVGESERGRLYRLRSEANGRELLRLAAFIGCWRGGYAFIREGDRPERMVALWGWEKKRNVARSKIDLRYVDDDEADRLRCEREALRNDRRARPGKHPGLDEWEADLERRIAACRERDASILVHQEL